MNRFLTLAILLLAVTATAGSGDSYLSDRLACFVIIPPGWNMDTSLANEIVISHRADNAIFVSIKRYDIERNSQIESQDDLVTAIEGLYRKIGISGVDKNGITYSIVDGKASFEREFDGYDLAGGANLKKWLQGTIVRHRDGGQILYLALAAAPAHLFGDHRIEFGIIMKSLRTTEPLSGNLVSGSDPTMYLLALLLASLSIFFFMRNRRIQKSRNPLGRDSGNFWRCGSCGRMNHNDTHSCHRCGAERVKVPISS